MNTEEIIKNQNRRNEKKTQTTLIREYIKRWYVLLITVLTCFVGYAAEVLIYSTLCTMNMPHFAAALIAIFLGGTISTLPFLILNISLAVRKKKYYAIAVGIIVMEIIGMAFFVYNQLGLNF